MPTKEELLAALREMGYDGDGSVADVIQYVNDHGGLNELTDEQITEILGKKADDDDDEEEEKEKSANKLSFKKLDESGLRSQLRSMERQLQEINKKSVKPSDRKAASGHFMGNRGDTGGSMKVRAERKRYERAIEGGKAVYSDPDLAAASGAWFKEWAGRGDAETKSILKSAGIDIKAHLVGNAQTGGNLVPDEFIPDLISLRNEYGVFRQHTKVIPMSRETATVPRSTAELTVYKPGEGAAPSQSDLNFNNVKLVASKRAVLAKISNEMVEDSAIAVADEWSREFVRALEKSIDNGAFNGDGTGTYLNELGFAGQFANISSPAGQITGASGTHTNWGTFSDLDPFQAMVGACQPYAIDGAAFFCSHGFKWNVLDRLAREAGGVTYAEATGAQTPRFLGFPVHTVNVMPNTAASAQIVCYFGRLDLASKLGDRRQMAITSSEHRFFDEDVLGFLGTSRDAINVHDLGDGSTAGPVVSLLTSA